MLSAPRAAKTTAKPKVVENSEKYKLLSYFASEASASDERTGRTSGSREVTVNVQVVEDTVNIRRDVHKTGANK